MSRQQKTSIQQARIHFFSFVMKTARVGGPVWVRFTVSVSRPLSSCCRYLSNMWSVPSLIHSLKNAPDIAALGPRITLSLLFLFSFTIAACFGAIPPGKTPKCCADAPLGGGPTALDGEMGGARPPPPAPIPRAPRPLNDCSTHNTYRSQTRHPPRTFLAESGSESVVPQWLEDAG